MHSVKTASWPLVHPYQSDRFSERVFFGKLYNLVPRHSQLGALCLAVSPPFAQHKSINVRLCLDSEYVCLEGHSAADVIALRKVRSQFAKH